jgi:hypothetical protein
MEYEACYNSMLDGQIVARGDSPLDARAAIFESAQAHPHRLSRGTAMLVALDATVRSVTSDGRLGPSYRLAPEVIEP